jgi:hypothetical protein
VNSLANRRSSPSATAEPLRISSVFLKSSCTSERSSGSRTEQMSPQGTQEFVWQRAAVRRSTGALLNGSR